MGANMGVHQQPDFRQKCLFGVIVMVCAGLGLYFEDEKVAEEREKQSELFRQRIQAFFQVLMVVAGCLVSGFNVLTGFLQAAGIQVGASSLAQWVVLLLICYGVITTAIRLVTFFAGFLRLLLKVGVVFFCFGLILTDHSVGIKTMVIRLVCLGFVCILLSISSLKDWIVTRRITHLEDQMTIVGNRLRAMEENRYYY